MGWRIHIMVDIGIIEIIGLGAPLGIIGTMIIVLYFSRKQAQGFNVDIETKVLNDLGEKVHRMAEIIIEKPSLQKIMYKLDIAIADIIDTNHLKYDYIIPKVDDPRIIHIVTDTLTNAIQRHLDKKI